MDLRPILAAHRERAERDKDAIMTLVRGGGRGQGGGKGGRTGQQPVGCSLRTPATVCADAHVYCAA